METETDQEDEVGEPRSLGLQLSRSILVLEKEQPHQLCYNGSLPLLFTTCEPSKSFYCSLKGPDYGCTRNLEEACTKFHLCNTPEEFFLVAGIILVTVVVLLMTGCLWCCFCCFCGRCCQNTCPCFARMRSPNEVSPVGVPGYMYQGLDHHIKQQPSMEYHHSHMHQPPSPSAPPPFTS